ncbi:MAG: UvrB/UvrC motif-containing protein [Phycisphaerales bacterium JB058]
MLCECCGQREATIHEVLIKGGTKLEKHLCEVCAQEAATPTPSNLPISELISKYMVSPGVKTPASAAPPESPAPTVCPNCSMSVREFRQHGLLGCPMCYVTFENVLAPLVERAHEGGVCHVGKTPRRALSSGRAHGDVQKLLGDARERADRLSALRKQLTDAVEREQYERAAQLRDEMRRVASIEGGCDEPEETS